MLPVTMKLLHGDCLDLLIGIPDHSVDLIISDMPFGSTNARWDTPVDLGRLWPQYRRICNGPVLLFAQTPFDKVLGMSNIKELRYEWIWEKSNATGHLNCKKAPMKAHENILVFYSKQPKYFPVKTSGHVRKTAVRLKMDITTLYGKQRGGHKYDSTERYPRDVLRFPSDKQRSKLHPTQKPIALMEYLVRTYSSAGDVVMDSFMGSGTTGLAAKNLGRGFVGIEKEKNFFDVAVKRLGEQTPA